MLSEHNSTIYITASVTIKVICGYFPCTFMLHICVTDVILVKISPEYHLQASSREIVSGFFKDL
jgi:hypothetical protein